MNTKTKLPLPQHCKDCDSRSKGIFCALEESDLDELSQYKVTNKYKKGQSLFSEGTPPYGLYCISYGNVKVHKASPEGKDIIIRIASDGDVLGHRSIFSDSNYQASATAVEDTSICFIDKKYIVKTIKEKPSVATNLISKLSKDLGASEIKLANMTQKSVRERLAELLLLLKESHGVDFNGNSLIDIRLTREELASMIGTATETVIRTLSEFKDDGYISYEGRKIIVDNESALLELANPTF